MPCLFSLVDGALSPIGRAICPRNGTLAARLVHNLRHAHTSCHLQPTKTLEMKEELSYLSLHHARHIRLWPRRHTRPCDVQPRSYLAVFRLMLIKTRSRDSSRGAATFSSFVSGRVNMRRKRRSDTCDLRPKRQQTRLWSSMETNSLDNACTS